MAEHFEILPSYSNPPVIETVLGVQFERLPRLSSAYGGAYWKSLDQAEWPNVSDASPIAVRFEEFTEEARWVNSVRLQLADNPSTRIMIRNKAQDRLIQVQDTRFHYNWIGLDRGSYPRYLALRDEFDRALKHFVEFVRENELGFFVPNHWEVTYVNVIPKGDIWKSDSDWNFFRPLGQMPALSGGLQVDGFTGNWSFLMPNSKGRMSVNWNLTKKTPEAPPEEEMIRLDFTAWGPIKPKADRIDGLFEGLDLGRETIVRSFNELMTAKANNLWGIQ